MSRAALQSDAIRSRLDLPGLGAELVVHESTQSTNDDVRREALKGAAHGLVIYAEEQSAGRGRREARWHAPPRSGLLHSILLRPGWPVQQLGRIPLVAGLAAARAIEDCCPGLVVNLKWPNDLWIGGKKVGGILAETGQEGGELFIVLGIGLNVLTGSGELAPEIREIATSLAIECGSEERLSREAIAAGILRHLDELLKSAGHQFGDLSRAIEDRLLWKGARVACEEGGKTVSGRLRGLGPDGELRLLVEDPPNESERVLVQAIDLRPE